MSPAKAQSSQIFAAFMNESGRSDAASTWMFVPIEIQCLQFDRFDFRKKSLVVIGEGGTDHIKHDVTDAADVHNVSSLTYLNCLVRLQIE
jgi:hypothetical protein